MMGFSDAIVFYTSMLYLRDGGKGSQSFHSLVQSEASDAELPPGS